MSGKKTFSVFSFHYNNVASKVEKLIPPLLSTEHKGSMGRIGVVGGELLPRMSLKLTVFDRLSKLIKIFRYIYFWTGSRDCAGAPYYVADSALRFGADLSFVFCSQQASIPIKSYSPEFMVLPFYEDEKMEAADLLLNSREVSSLLLTSRLPSCHYVGLDSV